MTWGLAPFHPRLDGEGGYGAKAFLAAKLLHRALEEMKAQNLADAEQCHILFKHAIKVMDAFSQNSFA